MRLVTLTLLGIVAASVSGCASITASGSESLAVSSDPPAAFIRVNGDVVAKTPATVNVPRKTNPVVEVFTDGRVSQFCPVGHAANGGFVAADVVMCVLLFPLGCLSFIDADGAWNQLSAPYCNVTLPPASAPMPPPTPALPVPPPRS